jgi:hypothetical protein
MVKRNVSQKLPPHLVSNGDVKRCSECGVPFSNDVKPSLSKAFAEHIRTAHKQTDTKVTAKAAGKD